MDSARIQALVYRGYGIAAGKIGPPYDIYRPSGANDPIAVGNKVITALNASFTPYGKDFQYGMAAAHGKPLYNGLFDATSIQVGDYFVGADYTYFVLSLDHIQPPLCARCQGTFTIMRPQGADQPGLNSYGGNNAAIEDPLMQNWPVSIELAKHGPAMGGLPGDAMPGGFEILMPYVSGIELTPSDIGIDAQGYRYVLGQVERTTLGWRIRAKQAVT